jgi:hypothetical protein
VPDEQPAEPDEDTWEMVDDGVVRHHRVYRTRFFDPTSVAGCPCPLERLSGVRRTNYVSRGADTVEQVVHEDWRALADPEEEAGLGEWIGITFFEFADVSHIPEKIVDEGEVGWDPSHPTAKFAGQKGWILQNGRWTRVVSGSLRPPNVPPEQWKLASAGMRRRAIRDWEELQASSAGGGAGGSAEAAPPPSGGERPVPSPAPALVPPPSAASKSKKSRKKDGPVDPATPAPSGAGSGCPESSDEGATTDVPDTSDDDFCLPAVLTLPSGHRLHHPPDRPPFNALVARPVGKKEAAEVPEAKAALQKEWDRLRAIKCWDESGVRPWSEVSNEARRTGQKCHVGRIFAICVEKNSELDKGNPARKYKGRVVFRGNDVRDENWDVAMFQELSSTPATMEGAKAADCYGLFPGHTVEQADAEQAYTQSKLGGIPTWVRLPPEQWPAHWKGVKDPVCPLVLALYGHPDSGGYWERHCEAHLRKIGFVEVEAWRSCFFHTELKVFLVVYVDDFKAAGPTAAVHKVWDMIRQGIRIGKTEPAGLYLGCKHVITTQINPDTGKSVRVMEYDMEEFMQSCVDRYVELSGKSTLRKVATPFIDDPAGSHGASIDVCAPVPQRRRLHHWRTAPCRSTRLSHSSPRAP